jgi:hypothetical protein
MSVDNFVLRAEVFIGSSVPDALRSIARLASLAGRPIVVEANGTDLIVNPADEERCLLHRWEKARPIKLREIG